MASNEPPPIEDSIVRLVLAAIPGVGGMLQVIYEDTRARYAAKVAGTIGDIVARAGPDTVARRLAEDPDLEALFVAGIETATRTGNEAKRRLLAKVIANAILDDAKVEESQLIAQALRDIDTPHIRALERFHRAEKDSPSGRATDNEEAMTRINANEPTPVLAVLIHTGVAVPATLVGGGVAIYAISDFGRALLDHLRESIL
jgi:hypothetical protein